MEFENKKVFSYSLELFLIIVVIYYVSNIIKGGHKNVYLLYQTVAWKLFYFSVPQYFQNLQSKKNNLTYKD